MVLDAINKVLVLGATVLGAINTSELGAIKALKQALTKPLLTGARHSQLVHKQCCKQETKENVLEWG
eukprot:1160367-Pelagomonas_calceolata.AAC.1